MLQMNLVMTMMSTVYCDDDTIDKFGDKDTVCGNDSEDYANVLHPVQVTKNHLQLIHGSMTLDHIWTRFLGSDWYMEYILYTVRQITSVSCVVDIKPRNKWLFLYYSAVNTSSSHIYSKLLPSNILPIGLPYPGHLLPRYRSSNVIQAPHSSAVMGKS